MSTKSHDGTETPNSLTAVKPEELTYDEKDQSESGKFKFLLGILKKVIGVADIINLRISLPSQILDPIPNLEYFNWLDRPDYFACLSEPEDPVERFIGVVRYSLTRYVKYNNTKLVKPYNSILGEQFMCHWDVTLPNSEKTATVNMLNEQTSHHPPVSAFWYECPETGVTAQGHDHISAKFTGTSFPAVKISPGDLAKGLYINLKNRNNEEYHVTHCSAYIHGFLTGSLGIGLVDRVVISCPTAGLRAVYDFKAEGWIGKNKYAVEGKIFKFKPSYNDGKTDADLPPPNFKFAEIKEEDLIATVAGSWRGKVNITRHDATNKTPQLLIDLTSLEPIPKIVKPIEEMGPLESRVVWKDVTSHILAREFGQATKAKHALEDRQRQLAAQRKETSTSWTPLYFHTREGEPHRPYINPDVSPSY